MKKIYILSLLTISSLQTYSQAGFLACYPFNNNAKDERGAANDGTLYNVIVSNDRNGTINSAYTFSGSQSSILIDNTNLKLSQYSYSVWLKPTQLPNNAYQAIFSNGGASYDQHLLIAHDPVNSRFGWTFGSWNNSGASHTCSPGITPSVNQWYHVVVTRSDDSMKLYVNGSMICSKLVSGTPGYIGSNNNLSIGSRNTTMSQNFQGIIDDFKIFNRALNSNEVLAVANGGCFGLNVNAKKPNLDQPYFIRNNELILMKNSIKNEIKSVTVYSIDGKLQKLSEESIEVIDISDLNNNVYLVKVEFLNGNILAQKIFKN